MNRLTNEQLVVEEPESLADKLKVAEPGEPVVYHVGRTLGGCRDAKAALAAYYRGEVELVQKRVRGALFCYLAIRRREVTPPEIPLALDSFVSKLLKEEPGS